MTQNFKVRKRALLGGILVLIAALLARNVIHGSQSDRIASVVSTFSRVFTTKLEEQVRNRLQMVEMIRRNLEGGRIGGVAEFAEVAETIHLDFTDLQALNWVSAEGVIEMVSPYDSNSQALGVNVTHLELPGETLREAIRKKTLRVTPPITLTQGGLGFVGYTPVRVEGELAGFINIVFRSRPLIESAMGAGTAEFFRIRITDGTGTVYGPADPGTHAEFASTSRIDVAGRTWTITTTPTAVEVENAQTLLDEFVLAGGILLAIGATLLLNVTAQSKDTLKRSEERFALAMKGASDGLFDWDLASDTVYFSPRWFEMLGYKPDELPSNFNTFETLLHPDDVTRVVKNGDAIYLTEGRISEKEFRMRHKNGSWVNILSRAFNIRKDGRITRIVGTHVDITELRLQQKELERAAMTDDLTGLYNRRGLAGMLSSAAGELTDDFRLAILHLDLDMFKSINDMNGHDAGDMVLKITAERLSRYHEGFEVVARVGGDEFLIVKRTDADNDRIVMLANTLIDEISQPIEFQGKLCRVGASIGIAFVTRGDDTSFDETIANADIALNSSKSMGRGRCVVFEPHMRDAAVRAVAVASEIRDGLCRDEFTPFFQPQIDMRTKRIVGFEALARWNHPNGGILGAAEFVPFAEKAHLVDAIDDQIFKKACRVVGDLDGLGAPDAKISVNLSTAQLSDPALVDRLIWTVDCEDVEPSRICIEILEATLLSERTAHVIRNIEDLAQTGFGLELDDFGTGHTAIASLRNFPVSRIKIDRTLITDIDSDPALQAIAGAIIDLGRNLGIKVLAEGIETEAESAYLASTRCNHGQGYLIGRPMPFEDLGAWIRDWNERHGLGSNGRNVA